MGYYVQVEPGVHVYLEDVNPQSGKTMLFLHGWPASHRMFEYQFDWLVQAGFRCIGMDIRGFGRSDKPAGGYQYDRLADDVARVIEALDLRNITLIGFSMGGAIALRYMARHGEKGVARLALMGAAAPSITPRVGFPYGIPADAVTDLISQSRSDRPQMLQNFSRQFFFRNTTAPFDSWFLSIGLAAAGWATAQCAMTFRDETLFDDLPKISVPTLLLHGVQDEVCRFPLALALRQGIRNSRLVPFENSGHGFFWEEREKVNRELEQFAG